MAKKKGKDSTKASNKAAKKAKAAQKVERKEKKKATKAKDMIEHAKHLLAVEKAWLLSQIGLISDCDDDVMDEQKWSSCSWLLLREFVRMRQADEEAAVPGVDPADLPLPKIPYVRTLCSSFDMAG